MIEVDLNQSDYTFNRSLSNIYTIKNNISSYYRLCLKVITKRYYFNSSNQTFSLTFNNSGIFNLDVYLYDSNLNFAFNSTFKISVFGSKFLFENLWYHRKKSHVEANKHIQFPNGHRWSYVIKDQDAISKTSEANGGHQAIRGALWVIFTAWAFKRI